MIDDGTDECRCTSETGGHARRGSRVLRGERADVVTYGPRWKSVASTAVSAI